MLTWLTKISPYLEGKQQRAHLLVYQSFNVEGLEHVGAKLGVEVHFPDALVQQFPYLEASYPHASSAGLWRVWQQG